MKQTGHNPKDNGEAYVVKGKGEVPESWPEGLRVRAFPIPLVLVD